MIRLLDEAHLKFPWYGSRNLRNWLRERGHKVGRKRVQRLMQVMGISSIAPGPQTSKRNKQHAVYPYLLRDLAIDRPNQVWATDITYIPMPYGHLYLVAILDLFSRKVLSWQLSNTLDAGFCIDALEEAFKKYGIPEIFNTDQGSQFTSDAFTKKLLDKEIRISMDGKGRWVDNVFVERLWRSVKYEEVYLRAYETAAEARESLQRYFEYYNRERFHSSLDNLTPDAVYYNPAIRAA